MAFPKIICLKQMIILGVDLIDVGQTEKEQEGARENVCIFKLVCVSVCVMERKRKRHEFKGYVWWGTLFSASWTLNDARTGTSISPSDALALLMLSLTNHTLVFLTCLFFFFYSKQYVMVWMFGSYVSWNFTHFVAAFIHFISCSVTFKIYIFSSTIFPLFWIVEPQQLVDKAMSQLKEN